MNRAVVRFTPSERWLHNIVMFSFVLLLCTGLAMVYFNLTGESREARDFLVVVHEIVSVLFIAGPILIFFFSKKKVWRENLSVIKKFGKSDFVWLSKKPVSVVNPSIELPKEDKFNAAQKIWIYTAISASFILTVTGIYIWINKAAILALFIHTSLSLFMTPVLLGHIYMALINPETRQGVTSIIDGEVDSTWAMAHHPIWMERMAKDRIQEQISSQQVSIVIEDDSDPPTELRL